MSIYRPPPRRWPGLVACLVAGLIVGGIAGALIARPRPTPADSVEPARDALKRAATILSVVEVEYAEAVPDGAVAKVTEYEGVRDSVARSRAAYAEARPALVALAPERVGELDAAYDSLQSLVDDMADPARVTAAARELAGLLTPGG